MNAFLNILSGGFLKGYRTHIITASLILGSVVVPWLVGDGSLIDLVKANWEVIAAAIGLQTARAA